MLQCENKIEKIGASEIRKWLRIRERRQKMRSEERLPGGVESLPFGLLAAFAGEKEIQITELAECGFRFRTAEEIEIPFYFKVCFYEKGIEGERQPYYREIYLDQFEVERVEKEKPEAAGKCEKTESCALEKRSREDAGQTVEGIEAYSVEYLVKTEQSDYQQAVRRLIGLYGGYVRLKLEGDDAALAQALVGYPADLDEEYCMSWEEQKREWRKTWEIETAAGDDIAQEKRLEQKVISYVAENGKIEMAVELDRPERYQAFLEQEPQMFYRRYCQEHGLTGHCFFQQHLGRIYIGNAFCPLLAPEEDCLFELLEKAYKNNLGITLTTSWIRDEQLDEMECLLDKIEQWCQTRKQVIEIQVNDWALADMLKRRRTWLKPCLGILLHKRRKDPRMRYLKGKMLSNREYADFYQEYLQEILGIKRLEEETSPMPFSIRADTIQGGRMKHSLHLPYYQTNTSSYCPLYAQIMRGARGRQAPVRECPQLCSQYTFLYPNHLKMVGRYNSLFGLNSEILYSSDELRTCVLMGVDRIVLNFL